MLTVKQVAKEFEVTARTILNWVQNKHITFPMPIKIGGAVRWDESEIKEYKRVMLERREKI